MTPSRRHGCAVPPPAVKGIPPSGRSSGIARCQNEFLLDPLTRMHSSHPSLGPGPVPSYSSGPRLGALPSLGKHPELLCGTTYKIHDTHTVYYYYARSTAQLWHSIVVEHHCISHALRISSNPERPSTAFCRAAFSSPMMELELTSNFVSDGADAQGVSNSIDTR